MSPRAARYPAAHPLGAAIRARRLALKLRQRDVAERAGLNIHTVWQIERGKVPPATSSLHRIAAVLGLTLVLVDQAVAERIAELAQTPQPWESLHEVKQRADRDQAALARARRRIAELERETASLKASVRRYEEAFDALGRQPVLTHDLIDQARAAASGNRTPERTAA